MFLAPTRRKGSVDSIQHAAQMVKHKWTTYRKTAASSMGKGSDKLKIRVEDVIQAFYDFRDAVVGSLTGGVGSCP